MYAVCCWCLCRCKAVAGVCVYDVAVSVDAAGADTGSVVSAVVTVSHFDGDVAVVALGVLRLMMLILLVLLMLLMLMLMQLLQLLSLV